MPWCARSANKCDCLSCLVDPIISGHGELGLPSKPTSHGWLRLTRSSGLGPALSGALSVCPGCLAARSQATWHGCWSRDHPSPRGFSPISGSAAATAQMGLRIPPGGPHLGPLGVQNPQVCVRVAPGSTGPAAPQPPALRSLCASTRDLRPSRVP